MVLVFLLMGPVVSATVSFVCNPRSDYLIYNDSGHPSGIKQLLLLVQKETGDSQAKAYLRGARGEAQDGGSADNPGEWVDRGCGRGAQRG